MRALTKRMSHIDEQIGQIFRFLSPLNTMETDSFPPMERKPSLPPPLTSSPPRPISPLVGAISPEINIGSVSISPLFEAPSFFSDLNATSTLFDPSQSASSVVPDAHDLPRHSRTSEHSSATPPIRQISGHDSISLSIPHSSTAYNRSTSSSITSLGASTTSRSSVSNKIAPAPTPSSPVSPKHPLGATFQPISNTRFNPGRSPKIKTRTHHNRMNSKSQRQYSENKSTIIEMESPVQTDVSNKTVPLLATSTKPTTLSTKSSGSVFRRFMTGGNNSERMTTSSTLLYPPTSDDEHPKSPVSSGNEDDDYRPLTSSSSKYHHHTPL